MLEPPIPLDEVSRLAALRGLNILDSSPEERFDRLTRLAQKLLGVQIAVVSLVDSNRQWFKSCQGLDASETPRSISFCGHAVLEDKIFIIPDALLDPRFADNPLVAGPPNIRFYAGQPLKTGNGSRVGTLCVIDSKPRHLTQAECDSLRDLATLVENELNALEYNEAVDELQSSRNRLNAILDNVLDGIITINEQGVVDSFNKSAENIFGYSANEVIGHNINMLMPEPYHSAHDCYLHNFTTTGKKKIIGIGREVTGKRKDCSTFPMDLAVSEMWLGDKRMFTGLVRDITERKKSEEDFANISRLSQAVVDGASHLIITTNTEGMILSFNRAAELALGYRSDELVGKKTPAVFHDPGEVVIRARELTNAGIPVEPGFGVFVARAQMQNEGETHEWTYIHKDGSRFPVTLTVSALRNSAGQIVAFLGIASDITERLKIERLKKEFVSTVSHELRTPLTSIRGSLGLLAGGVAGELPSQAKKLVNVAHKNSERLILLVNDILDMEKVEAGKMEFELEPTELISLLIQAMEANRAYAAQFNVSYVLEGDTSKKMVDVDPNRLLQVFANLLSNAAKFSPADDHVAVAASVGEGRVRVAISDHGVGIPEKFRNQIFEKFSQADSSDTRQRGGTGLGLSITKAIVEKMGGSIGFDSRPNVMTTFWVEFPILQDVAAPPHGQEGVGNKKHVLICEDDGDIAILLSMMMQQAGLSTDIAFNAAQAKKMLAQRSYAAMTLDLGLPDQSGISLIRELRATKETATLPILVVSANAVAGRKELNDDVFRVVDWISKPVQQEQLVVALRRAMGQVSVFHPSVLHVEDDPDIVQVVRSIVGDIATVESASRLSDARKMLNERRYDLVILDIALPDGSGRELLPILNKARPPIPVLVFSANEFGAREAGLVSAALVKSRTDNDQLLATIKRLVKID